MQAMPSFDDATTTAASAEEVWKALYDPARYPSWWVGWATVEPGEDDTFTMYPVGYPDFPMPQQVRTERGDHRVTVSCQVSNLVFEWRLDEEPSGGTRISVHVEIPEEEAHRLADQRAAVHGSLVRLADLAGATVPRAAAPRRR
jgi:uncharacterized protein YndB with AHSA1/START domain